MTGRRHLAPSMVVRRATTAVSRLCAMSGVGLGAAAAAPAAPAAEQ